MRQIKLSAVGILALALMGCASPRYTVLKVLPPAALLIKTEANPVTVVDNGTLALKALTYKSALGQCNIDKASLREWVAGQSKE